MLRGKFYLELFWWPRVQKPANQFHRCITDDIRKGHATPVSAAAIGAVEIGNTGISKIANDQNDSIPIHTNALICAGIKIHPGDIIAHGGDGGLKYEELWSG